MQVLERYKTYYLEEPETKTATGRFFYIPEDSNESIYSRIINYTNQIFEFYKIEKNQNLMLVQLAREGNSFCKVEPGGQGDNLSLQFNGLATDVGQLPLWELTIANRFGRVSHGVVLEGGLHVVERTFDHQGKLVDMDMNTVIGPTIEAIETILEDEFTHDYFINHIPAKYLKGSNTTEVFLANEFDRVIDNYGEPERFVYKCNFTPEQARDVLREVFDNNPIGDVFHKLYLIGRDSYVNRVRLDSYEVKFFIIVETLSERAAKLHDKMPDDII